MTKPFNFLEEEDYETPAPPQRTPVKLMQPTVTTTDSEEAENIEPKFGEPGFGKGKPNPRKGTPRARVTDLDIPILYFLGHFPGADAEACSMLNTAKKTVFGDETVGGGLTSIATTQNRLTKLIKLNVVEKYRHPVSGTYFYGLTEEGLEIAKESGLDMRGARIFKGLAASRLGHYRAIALVAAKFASPAGYFRRAGIEPISLTQLVSENRMRAAFTPVQRALKEKKSEGKREDFAVWRAAKLEEALAEVNSGSLPASELINAYPVLLTLGQPAGTNAKAVKQPDLVVNLDADRTDEANNLLIEVELSIKERAEYERIMATLAAELKSAHVYRRALYFTVGSQVQKILKQIDAAKGYKLFESKQLIVVQLTGRNGEPIAQNKRPIVGGN